MNGIYCSLYLFLLNSADLNCFSEIRFPKELIPNLRLFVQIPALPFVCPIVILPFLLFINGISILLRIPVRISFSAERGNRWDVGWNLFMNLLGRLFNGVYSANTPFAFSTFLVSPASFYVYLMVLPPDNILSLTLGWKQSYSKNYRADQ